MGLKGETNITWDYEIDEVRVYSDRANNYRGEIMTLKDLSAEWAKVNRYRIIQTNLIDSQECRDIFRDELLKHLSPDTRSACFFAEFSYGWQGRNGVQSVVMFVDYQSVACLVCDDRLISEFQRKVRSFAGIRHLAVFNRIGTYRVYECKDEAWREQ